MAWTRIALLLLLAALPGVARSQPLAEIERASATLRQQNALPPRPAQELLQKFRRAIDWQSPRSRGAAQFRTALNEALAEFWQNPAAGLARQVAAQRFLVVMPGCGTQCQVLLLVDLATGVAINPDITTGLGASFALNNAAIIADPASEIRQLLGPGGLATPVQSAGYVLSPQGTLRRRFAIEVR